MMKRIAKYTAALLLCILSASCHRRPLTTADYTVIVNISIDTNIVNYKVEKDPSLMRCIFYDSESGAFVTQAFLPPTGGQVSLIPAREYDVLVYNFDTESTWLEEENWFHKIYASTSLIPDSFKTKLRSRASKTDEELIVYDPDHLYVGRLNDVFIPSRSAEAGTGSPRAFRTIVRGPTTNLTVCSSLRFPSLPIYVTRINVLPRSEEMFSIVPFVICVTGMMVPFLFFNSIFQV